jgi:hypothetical protein
LIESLRKRFRFVFNNDIFPASTFLNHKYRKFEFIQDLSIRSTTLNKAKSYIISKFNVQTEDFSISSAQPTSASTPLRNITNSSQNTSALSSISSSSSISSKSRSLNSSQKKMNNFLSKLVVKQSINFITADQSELEQEIVNFESHQYINTSDDDEIESSLMFFKHNANSYPLLINVAKYFLHTHCISSC